MLSIVRCSLLRVFASRDQNIDMKPSIGKSSDRPAVPPSGLEIQNHTRADHERAWHWWRKFCEIQPRQRRIREVAYRENPRAAQNGLRQQLRKIGVDQRIAGLPSGIGAQHRFGPTIRA